MKFVPKLKLLLNKKRQCNPFAKFAFFALVQILILQPITKVSLIGTGVMSKSIIAHLINKYSPSLEQVTFFSRTKEKAMPLLNPQNYQQQETKLIWKDSPKEAAVDSDVGLLILCLFTFSLL